MRFTLMPKFPYTGNFFVMVWWNNHAQHQVIIHRTMEQVLASVRRHLMADEGARVKEIWRATFISPPELFAAKFRRQQVKEAVDVFIQWVQLKVGMVYQKTGQIPAGFSWCQKYEHRYQEELGPDDDWMAQHHFYCRNCREKPAKLITGTWRTLFWRKRHLMYEEVNLQPSPRRMRGNRAARPGEPIYVMIAQEGHHKHGVMILPLELSNLQGGWGTWIGFFQGEKVPIPPEVDQMVEERDAILAARNLARVHDDEKSDKQEVERDLKILKDLMTA